MITAFSAVINGGYLVEPYVVESITDDDGGVIQKTEPTVIRQVISEETSQRAAAILEKVVSDPVDGTGKNAYLAGYRIGGKTGTSETSVKGEVVVSFMAFAPADDPEVAVLLAYNTPARASQGADWGTTGVYISGGNMPAVKMGPLMGEILDYLGVEKQYTAEEAATADVPVPRVTGLSVEDARTALTKKKLSYRTVGSGTVVTAQVPTQGNSIPGGSSVILYLDEEPEQTSVVPDVVGLGYEAAKKKLENSGFFMRASGANTYYSTASKVLSQSIAAEESAPLGTVVDVRFSTPQVEDGYLFTD
jgi:stage V sporulation protein D (sporulation-specific penicillin-binding protein)